MCPPFLLPLLNCMPGDPLLHSPDSLPPLSRKGYAKMSFLPFQHNSILFDHVCRELTCFRRGEIPDGGKNSRVEAMKLKKRGPRMNILGPLCTFDLIGDGSGACLTRRKIRLNPPSVCSCAAPLFPLPPGARPAAKPCPPGSWAIRSETPPGGGLCTWPVSGSRTR